MKPVAIFRYSATDGPGYFAEFLDRHEIPWRLIRIDAGDAVPQDPRAFAGLGLMGGPMSANDDLPWIAPLIGLVRRSIEQDVPVIGHCLGGQIMSRALGGVVSRNPVLEVGWGRVCLLPREEARHWLGALEAFESFHWHGETFTVPPVAVRIAWSAYCENQMFALGPHLALQCHIEMTPELIAAWCADWHEVGLSQAAPVPSVQTPEQMLNDVAGRVERLHGAANRIYETWIKGLVV